MFRIKCITIICVAFTVYNLCLIKADEAETTTTLEPEGTTGCPPPNFKVSRPKKYQLTTEQPFVTFETTQLYLPQDFSTEDLELVDKKQPDGVEISSGEQFDRNTQKDSSKVKENPFWFEDVLKASEFDFFVDDGSSQHKHENTRRAKRNHHKNLKKLQNNPPNPSKHIISRRSAMLLDDYPNDEQFYVESVDIISNLLNENDTKSDDVNFDDDFNLDDDDKRVPHEIPSYNESSSHDNRKIDYGEEKPKNGSENLNRVKRKSGKATSALNRPKGIADSKSKTSRKQHLQIDDGGHYMVDSEENPHSKEAETDSEEIDESPEQALFREISEVRFPAEIGPLGGNRLCKIKCIDGYWTGPLCSAGDQDESGNIKFEPLYKRCVVDQIPPHLLLSYKNVSVTLGWDLPHGHTLQARCRDLGLYKLLGESKVLCSNGLWAPRMPTCTPTTLLTNFSDDSPPSIRVKVGVGSAAYEPSGVLAVLPASTLHLDCIYPRRRGSPEWTWTGWFRQYLTGWSALPEEKASRYRLSIKDIQNQDSGTYTCASPRGLTNSVVIIVAVSQCPSIAEPVAPLSLRLEGLKLGQRALYRCPMGYTLQGTENATCLASGNWSFPAPNCIPIQCPPLYLEDPNLSLVELNTSAWGRAVFRCAWGFRLNGAPGIECEPNGRWSGPMPRCRAIQCPQPSVPINGKIDGTSGLTTFGPRRHAVGALITFSCSEGHSLTGEASIVCTETGFWSHPPPFCKSQCAYPGDPPNGLIAPLKFHYDPGDILIVQCRPGFVESGSKSPSPERPKCLEDGNWSMSVPQCKNVEE